MSKDIFSNITSEEYHTLCKILKNPNSTPVAFFFDDPTIDGRVQELDRAQFISIRDGKMNITELGRAAIKEYELSVVKEKEALYRQRKHDFLIATYGIVGGIISGVVSSLIVLYIQGLL